MCAHRNLPWKSLPIMRFGIWWIPQSLRKPRSLPFSFFFSDFALALKTVTFGLPFGTWHAGAKNWGLQIKWRAQLPAVRCLGKMSGPRDVHQKSGFQGAYFYITQKYPKADFISCLIFASLIPIRWVEYVRYKLPFQKIGSAAKKNPPPKKNRNVKFNFPWKRGEIKGPPKIYLIKSIPSLRINIRHVQIHWMVKKLHPLNWLMEKKERSFTRKFWSRFLRTQNGGS